MGFVHLHVHTVYSLLDGICRTDRLISSAKKAGQTAIAITDHGVMYGAIEFFKEAKKQGVKPIIGCEVYVASGSRFEKNRIDGTNYYHLVLLCENMTGYNNLIKLVSYGFTEGFYSKPRIDRELLEKHHEGLIALSACLAGEIPRALESGEYEKALNTAKWYDNLFGRGNFFLELQDHGIAEQKNVNPLIMRISRETGIPLVATNDVHYIEPEDYITQKVLLCVQMGKKLSEDNPVEFKTNEFYLKTEQEMRDIFQNIPEAIENTNRIAERCNIEFEFGKIKLPVFDIGDRNHNDYFREKCFEGLYRIYGKSVSQPLVDRLEYELSVIQNMGYVDYYLIVQDYVAFAKKNGIPVGPGRGSGAASLAAYCLGITGIDPIRFQLLFERFLNPERVSMPDFDIDFCYVRRQEVIDYVKQKYGQDHVAQIVAFGTLAARAAVRDVGRVLDIPYATCDKVAKLIPNALGITIESALQESKELNELVNTDTTIAELINIAKKVEGMPRNTTTHAAGVVITDKPVSEYVPLSLNDDAVVTQFPMTTLEELGLLKMDFLGLRNLTVIADAEREIQKTNPSFNIEDIRLDDIPTISMMAEGNTEGVFQFESAGMKSVLKSFVPENIEDLIAIISLYRPGPMDSIPKYIHNRHHPESIHYDTPLLRPILDVTYGCIVYQEQVMQICREIAGYSFGRADIVRRAMSKKKHDVMQQEERAFIYGEVDANGNVICDGAIKRGVPERIAKKIFSEMSAFSSYAFNKAHAAAYAHVAYQTAYLKCHYPGPYMAALLTSVLSYQGKISSYSAECQRLGLKVLPPHVNFSFLNFRATNEEIRFGLLAVKNIGAALIEKLIEERESNGLFTSYFDFCKRLAGRDLNRRALEGLIKSGALDGLADNRRQMLQSIDLVLDAVDADRKYTSGGQMDLFSTGISEFNSNFMSTLPIVEEMPKIEMLKMEKEATGMYLSSHPMNDYVNLIKSNRYATAGDILSGKFKDNQYVSFLGMVSSVLARQSKNNQQYAVVEAEDAEDSVKITLFSKAYLSAKHFLSDGAVLKFNCRVTEREDRPTELICDAVVPVGQISPVSAAKLKTLYLRLESINSDVFVSVKEILKNYPGKFPVIIYCVDTGKKLQASKDYFCDCSHSLINELIRLLGENNVKTVE